MNLSDYSEKERGNILESMIDELVGLGFPMTGPRQALRAGEDGVCFRSIFRTAQTNEEYSRKWAAELSAFNEFFTQDKYMRHIGYPLS